MLGDKMQLFQNDIYIQFRNGTILNGPADTVETHEETISISYKNEDGIYVIGYLSQSGEDRVFHEK